MKVAVRYYTKSGNTKMLAEKIASVAGMEAKPVRDGLDEKVDLLFLGSSVYAAGVDPAVKDFFKKQCGEDRENRQLQHCRFAFLDLQADQRISVRKRD